MPNYMKKIITCLLILPSCFFAQITINSSQFPNVGDTLRMSVGIIDQSIDFQISGPDQNWDFSTLILDSQVVNQFKPISASSSFSQLYFGSFAPLEYRANYFTEELAFPISSNMGSPIPIEQVIRFTQLNSDSMSIVGYAMTTNGTEIPVKSDIIEKVYDFPLVYDNSWQSKGFTVLNLNPLYNLIFKQAKERYSVIDGWGTITTPFGSFEALRIKHIIYEVDSLYFDDGSSQGQWTIIPVPESHEYEWYSNTEKNPILKITTNINLGVEIISNITYRDIYRESLNLTEKHTLSTRVFPNPVTNNLYIQSTSKLDELEICSLEGKIIEHIQPNAFFYNLNTSSMAPGSYLVKLKSSDQFQIVPFIKR